MYRNFKRQKTIIAFAVFALLITSITAIYFLPDLIPNRIQTTIFSIDIHEILGRKTDHDGGVGFFSLSGIPESLIHKTQFGLINANSAKQIEESFKRVRGTAFKISVDLDLVISSRPCRSGSVCLNNKPRFISGLQAVHKRCRVVHGGGGRL